MRPPKATKRRLKVVYTRKPRCELLSLCASHWSTTKSGGRCGNKQLFPQGCCRSTHPAGGATHCGRRPGTTHPAYGVSGCDGRRQNLLDLSPGCPAPRAGESPAGGQLQERGVDWHLCRVGEQSGGLACATAPHPVCATLAT